MSMIDTHRASYQASPQFRLGSKKPVLSLSVSSQLDAIIRQLLNAKHATVKSSADINLSNAYLSLKTILKSRIASR